LNKESIGQTPLTDALFLFFSFRGGAAIFSVSFFCMVFFGTKGKRQDNRDQFTPKRQKTLTWAQKKGMIRFVTIL